MKTTAFEVQIVWLEDNRRKKVFTRAFKVGRFLHQIIFPSPMTGQRRTKRPVFFAWKTYFKLLFVQIWVKPQEI